MKQLIITLISIILFSSPVMGGALSLHKTGKVEQSAKVSDVKNIQGFFGKRMEINKDAYLKQFPIDKYVDFIVRRQHEDWNWTQAEQHGKWLESAYLSAIQQNDDQLLEKAECTLNRIIASQEPEGYVGATSLKYRSSGKPIRGMDPYELYFVFHAFISVYEETGNKKALNAAEKLADYFIRYFGPGKLEFWPSDLRFPENKRKNLSGTSDFAGHSVHYGWEGTLLCDPIARLYEITGNKKYLNWSRWVINNIDKWSGWDAFSRLDSVADGKIGIDKLQPYVHSHTFHMNFMGFLRVYLATGDKSLLRKVEGAWDDINKRQMYITGGVSVAEHYEHDFVKPLSGNIVETCATMSWMQLTQMLLEITGDPRYADAIERIMVNHVFAAQDALTGSCRYHTAPNGTKPSGYFHGPDCCTASGHRIISLIPSFLYAKNGKVMYINQYLASDYKDGNVDLSVGGNYPEDENIRITLNKDAAMTLSLRIPGWCANPQVSINGTPVDDVQPGTYLRSDRKWKKGDRIDLHFPMELTWNKRENHSEYPSYRLEGGEIMYKEEPAKSIPYALTRGPVVYALDMVWNQHLNNDDADMSKDIKVDVSQKPQVAEMPASGLMGPAFKTIANYKGRKVDVNLLPFANTGQWVRPGQDKPDIHSDEFSYAIWLYP